MSEYIVSREQIESAATIEEGQRGLTAAEAYAAQMAMAGKEDTPEELAIREALERQKEAYERNVNDAVEKARRDAAIEEANQKTLDAQRKNDNSRRQ
jgi:hypothetical protein